MKFKKYPLVCIDWEDHHGDAGWVEKVSTDDEILKAQTIGWLVDESKKAYHVMDTRTSDGGHGGYSLILKSCVTNILIMRKKH